MQFLIIPDSFKNCLSAKEVGNAISRGIAKIYKNSKIKIIPIADGGEGTVEAIVYALDGKIVKIQVHDPLMRPIESFIGISKNGTTAIIEMAAASGIELINDNERNPLITSTYGTGELIKGALDIGCKEIIIGIGGSATNDGGVGMATALGARFYNENNDLIKQGGGSLCEIHHINLDNLDPRLKKVSIKVACDVKNLLYGENGASTTYGPQKGATSDMVKLLDNNLEHLSNSIKNNLNIDVSKLEGGGAAGGLGAGLYTFASAKLERGFDIIADLLNIESHVINSDIIITAEGSVDYQTLFGKTPAGVAGFAKKYNKPLFVFTGNATDAISDLNEIGITSLIPITRKPIELSNALKQAPNWLETAAQELCCILKAGEQIKSI